MRKLLVLLAVTRAAHADPLGEYGEMVSLRSPEQLRTAACDYQLELRGAIVDGWLREHIDNAGPLALGAVDELVLPRGARVIGATLDGAAAVAVPAPYSAEPSSDAVGPDPAILTALRPDDAGRPRFRAIVAPFARTATLAVHFTTIADIRGGALRVTLPASKCHGTVAVKPGPGATLARLRVGNLDTRGPFELHGADAEVIADLAFARPLTWTQTEGLGDGFVARAQTRLAPLSKPAAARRVLFVIDASRSMQLVGGSATAQVLDAIGSALPAGAEVEAVLFDRTPARVFAGWKPASPETVTAIEHALGEHAPGNGSDPVAAFALAHNVLAEARTDATTDALVIAISDGAFGALGDADLIHALDASEAAVDLHAIVIERGQLTAQTDAPLRRAVSHYGGSYVEVNADELTGALAELDSWLRPASTVGGQPLLAGTGSVQLSLARGAAGTPGAPAPVAQLALAGATAADLDPGADGDALDRAGKQLATLAARHPWAGPETAFSVLSSHGKVARARHDAVAGGGPFTRTTLVPDPPFSPEVAPAPHVAVAVASIDRQLLETLFQLQLQPPAYVCYQRAIGRAQLAGTVTFHLEISRGEVTRATVDGLGDPAFDSCLLDAAYRLAPPMPDPSYNTDDRSIVSYPLTFQLHEQKPLVIAGDADSSSPLDIDAIKGGAPRPRHVTPVDTSTPLGNLRPTVEAKPDHPRAR